MSSQQGAAAATDPVVNAVVNAITSAPRSAPAKSVRWFTWMILAGVLLLLAMIVVVVVIRLIKMSSK